MLCRRALSLRARLHASIRPLTYSQWSILFCRSYAATTVTGNGDEPPTPDPPTPKTSNFSFETVTTDIPSRTSIEQLVASLTEAKEFTAHDVPSSSAGLSLVLLLTPAFAQYALDDQLPLKVWRRLVGSGNVAKAMESVTAVVDRLPPTHRLSNNPSVVGDATRGGQEGLACFLTSQKSTESGVFDEIAATPEQTISLRDKPGILGFTLFSDAERAVNKYTVELPLAQTIFSTGRVSTLLHAKYAQNDENDFELENRHEPKSMKFNLPIHYRPHLNVPLVPLTPARQVKYSVGNILRQLWESSDVTASAAAEPAKKAEGQPASQELEDAISAYFEARRMHPQSVSVWALVIPKSRERKFDNGSTKYLLALSRQEIRSFWNLDHSKKSLRYLQHRLDGGIMNLINLRARLCKVLSGGGGWGKKAGLLSLDPDTSYSIIGQDNTQLTPPQDTIAVAKNLDEDVPDAFGHIAEEGDQVMFFLAPAGLVASGDSVEPTHETEKPEKSSYTEDGRQSVVFGALPSSIDSTPVSVSPSTIPTITHTRNHFGMLSEGGMAAELSFKADRGSESRSVFRTKLDVPYARFNGLERQPTEPTEPAKTAKRVKGKKAVKAKKEAKTEPSVKAKDQAKAEQSVKAEIPIDHQNRDSKEPSSSANAPTKPQRPQSSTFIQKRILDSNPRPATANSNTPGQGPTVRFHPKILFRIISGVHTAEPPFRLSRKLEKKRRFRNKTVNFHYGRVRRRRVVRSNIFEMMAQSVKGASPPSSSSSTGNVFNESTKKELLEGVDVVFNQR